ncbi:Probable U6 snRNA-associated Sm-like protein LSm4 [Galdieria sulphuraria]|uniref:U6 snRNA-associated Sm-like protein LSm4 n=1 Tax=Galdieria sulphuraria TaxID=130081 RepID=M2VUE0_GALSU|nr:U6 snRNA-associated Sm-like protein LSm4 isoform 1 [Galdieria sulphuraria]EME26801.1 U6 snRNA-associated Sm-like protein LSm4 isoform 1 [Galdieria sulphuraria]GJD11284.1 Probable U6 snRNA-associated Sm-like protein LSm4 [Galdieria sulphuraria]|eukprot:XP_005703321.1 U6 snRNA-associated Sm-like protein LSm4 isoform 1 [Galdieria sulphuraria]
MVLPLSLLKAAQGQPVLVELKSGDTYNGHLVNIDSWMNLNLREVVWTSREGDRFWKIAEIYVRGNTVKYLRVPEEIVDTLTDQQSQTTDKSSSFPKNRRPGSRGKRRWGS